MTDTANPAPLQGQQKLKQARAEIEAILKRHDIAGFVTLHTHGWGEVFWNIWPSYSCLIGDFPSIRVKSKVADYAGDTARQLQDQASTAQMIHILATEMSGSGLQFLQLANLLDIAFDATHDERGFIPDASKSNPGTH